MHLKNVGFTYKSQIFKFMIQQKVFNKKLRNDTFNCSNISLYQQQLTFRVFKIQKTCNFLNFLKEPNNFWFLAIFSLKKGFIKYKEN